MILFEEDWSKQYGGRAVYQDNTKNFSFIKMSVLLNQLHVKNNKFMLTLVQPELAKYDPHNLTDNSTELRAKIGYECKINPWYYFREVIRIPIVGGVGSFFKLDRANMALIWCYYNNIDIFETISRQLGKTVSTQGVMSHVLFIWGYKVTVGMFTNARKLINENVARLKSIRDALPDYLIDKSIRSIDNKEGLEYKPLENKYSTFVVPDSEYDADNVGRGLTIPSMHWDEFGYTKNVNIAYSVAMSATTAAVEQAKLNAMPHSNIITTTAALLDSPSGKYAYETMKKAMRFTDNIYDTKNKEELRELLKKNSLNGMMYITYSFLQLGKSKEWFLEAITKANKTADEIDTDYLLIWKHGAENSVVPSSLLQKLKDNELEPLYTEIIKKDNYKISWYISKVMRESSEFKNRHLIIALDSSENIGKDFSSIVIIDPSDMAVVCTMKCNESNIIDFALFIVSLLLEFKNSIFIPERKNTGVAITDMVLLEFEKKSINPYFRIYNTVIQNYSDPKNKEKNIYSHPRGEERRQFGFSTTSESRNLLYKQVLLKSIQMNYSRIYDNNLINEISQLTTRNGRIDHNLKGHDDTVFAYLLACYLIFFGENLDKYGLNDANMLTRISGNGEEVESSTLTTQDAIRNRIMFLEKAIKKANSILVKKSFERELEYMLSQLDENILPVETISRSQLAIAGNNTNSNIAMVDIRNFFKSLKL